MESDGHRSKFHQRQNVSRKTVPITCFSRIHSFIHRSYVFRYSDQLALEDAVHTAILTLKESFEGQMTEDNIEIGICDKEGFRRLSPAEVKDYLAQIA